MGDLRGIVCTKILINDLVRGVVETMDPIVEVLKYLSLPLAVGLSAVGAGIGIAWSSPAVAGAGAEKPETISRNLISIVLSEALAIYGLIVGLLLFFKLAAITETAKAISAFSAGFTIGLAALGAGIGIGLSGNAMAMATAKDPKLFARLLLGVVLSEALAIYGLVVALLIVLGI